MSNPTQTLFPSLEYLGGATRYVEDILEIVDRLPLFEDLRLPEIESLCSFMHCFGAPRNAELLTEGRDGDFLLIVLTGSVKVTKHCEGGDKLVALVGPGATLGEMSMIDGAPRFASCITVEPTDFAVLTRSDLNEILVNMPRLGNKFLLVLLQLMTRRLRQASESLLPHLNSASV
ncbi:MAG: cyclic nucleotide-binding domain-containing protein [Rhodocyclaceae bacterium]|nr:cyclic nucleotide-binding domain-containing protein [Rhodocyclaceae bacterium]